MNKYIVLYSGSTVQGITPYVSLEMAPFSSLLVAVLDITTQLQMCWHS